jgi:hypothetical protein
LTPRAKASTPCGEIVLTRIGFAAMDFGEPVIKNKMIAELKKGV